jgi:hypothetical protein
MNILKRPACRFTFFTKSDCNQIHSPPPRSVSFIRHVGFSYWRVLVYGDPQCHNRHNIYTKFGESESEVEREDTHSIIILQVHTFGPVIFRKSMSVQSEYCAVTLLTEI